MSRHHGMVRQFDSLISLAVTPKVAATKSADGVQSVFGRLFDAQPENEQPSVGQLSNLASSMEDTAGEEGDAADVPLGMVFFGQFIDHDLTLDVTTQLGRNAGDVSRIRNFRTPRLELDSV